MPADFLVQQMALRESLEEAVETRDGASLDSLRKGLAEEKRGLEKQLGESIDANNDYAGAAGLVRKLMFLDKLDTEIDLAYEALE